jgi:hypothetical protein
MPAVRAGFSPGIPVWFAPRDLMASAQTGTGKTAAFVLPALQRLLTPIRVPGRGPRVLVLTPTRELAMQVSDNIAHPRPHCASPPAALSAACPIPADEAAAPAARPAGRDPGRLMDHMEAGRVDFSRLEILVLDEADRMLDMGFVDAVRAHRARHAGHAPDAAVLGHARGQGAQDRAPSCSRIRRASSSPTTKASMPPSPSACTAPTTPRTSTLLRTPAKNDGITQAVIFTATKRGADTLARRCRQGPHQRGAARRHEPGPAQAHRRRMRRGSIACWWRPTSPRAVSTSRHQPRDQLRPADGRRGLYPPHRPHRPRRRQGIAISFVGPDVAPVAAPRPTASRRRQTTDRLTFFRYLDAGETPAYDLSRMPKKLGH